MHFNGDTGKIGFAVDFHRGSRIVIDRVVKQDEIDDALPLGIDPLDESALLVVLDGLTALLFGDEPIVPLAHDFGLEHAFGVSDQMVHQRVLPFQDWSTKDCLLTLLLSCEHEGVPPYLPPLLHDRLRLCEDGCLVADLLYLEFLCHSW